MKNMKKAVATMCVTCLMGTTVHATNTQMDKYTVQPGDTLWTISQMYKVNLDDVIEANKQFDDPNLIHPDDLVYVALEGNTNTSNDIGAACTDTGDGSQYREDVKKGSEANVTSQSGESAFESQVTTLVNKERAKEGIAPLSLSSDVSNVARVKSEDMVQGNYFAHESPTYGSPFDMLKRFAISYSSAGENIAKGQKTAESVVNAWMNSEGHRKNIMNDKFSELGVGYATDANGTPYWTQLFITR